MDTKLLGTDVKGRLRRSKSAPPPTAAPAPRAPSSKHPKSNPPRGLQPVSSGTSSRINFPFGKQNGPSTSIGRPFLISLLCVLCVSATSALILSLTPRRISDQTPPISQYSFFSDATNTHCFTAFTAQSKGSGSLPAPARPSLIHSDSPALAISPSPNPSGFQHRRVFAATVFNTFLLR